MKTVFKGWDDIDKIIHKSLTPFYEAARWGHRAFPLITHAHYPGGAMGTSRPTAITHRHYPRASPAVAHRRALPPLHPRNSHAHYTRALRTRCSHAHYSGDAIVGRRDSRLAPRDTRGDEARETKVGGGFLAGTKQL